MKEATGELNMTVIVVISVGILSAFFFYTLWPMIKGNFQGEANCKSATCNCSNEIREANDGKCECMVYKADGQTIGPIYCPYGG